jgi:hypothetical protein
MVTSVEVVEMAKPGPKTAKGKALVRLNALQHGVLSTTPVIPGLEREEDWEVHRAGILASLAPEGELELALAERVAFALWRLQRVVRYERETVAAAQERVEYDLAKSREQEYEEPTSIEEARENLRSAQEDLRPLETHAREEPEELLDEALESAQAQVRQAQEELHRLMADVDQMRAERLLRDDRDLNKLVRYEAHLHRQLLQTLHELEALQARRRGGEAPLARVDVQGLPEE